MSPKSVREKSIEKIKLLRDPLVSAAFRHYFRGIGRPNGCWTNCGLPVRTLSD